MTRESMAEAILYNWACDCISTATAKRECRALGFEIDFRQADIGNQIDALDVELGQIVTLEC